MSKLKAAEKTFEYFYERLLKGFRSVENREPNNLEMILIRQEAGNKARDAAKVIEVDFGKPFSKEIEAMIKSGDVKVGKADKTPPYEKSQADIEFEIMEKIKSDNEKAVRAFESRNPKKKEGIKTIEGQMEKINKASSRIDEIKKEQEAMYKPKKDFDPPEDMAIGGRAGYGIGSFVQRRGNSNQNMPAVDARMNIDYDTLISQNEAQRNLQAQKRNKPIMLNDVNQVGMPRAITQEDINTFNFNMSNPMITGFDYSQSNNWSPGQPAPDGYRVANMLGDTYLERIYPSKEEVAGLPGMVGLAGPMPLGLMMPPSDNYEDFYREDPDAGLSGQEYAEKYGLEYALGGRAGYYTGGMVDVEPSLSDIGHGSDALMARTRLVSPGSQSTTSTGLNYLLAEDNDNIRVPFSKGKLADAARRKFMKAAGATGAGIAALKTGLLGLGEKAAPVIEKAVETAKGVPPYFFQLVDLIKSKGREIESYGERVKQYISPSKDGKSELMLTEDLNTGDIQVKKIFKENDDMVTKSEEMNFTKGRGDESTKGTPADDYEEVTEYNSRIYKDEFNDPDVVDGINVEDITKELIETKTKKASGGRIGFDGGGSPLQRLRQEIVDSMKGYAPGDVTEDQLQLVVKDITLDMTPEQAQASALSNFRKLFGMAKGGLAGMLGE